MLKVIRNLGMLVCMSGYLYFARPAPACPECYASCADACYYAYTEDTQQCDGNQSCIQQVSKEYTSCLNECATVCDGI
jgi:hypothetical protein